MRLRFLMAFCGFALACGGTAQPVGGTGTTSGRLSGTTSADATSGSGTAAATAGSTGTTGAAATTGSTGAATAGSGGSTSGSAACAPNAIWVGETCVFQPCLPSLSGLCALGDGGIGTCSEGTCLDVTRDSNNCGAAGIRCPSGVSCDHGSCVADGGAVCAGGHPNPCAPGLSCEVDGRGCVVDVCGDAPDGVSCSGASLSECCGQSCRAIEQDSQNCGGCGLACASGASCFGGQCVAACGTDDNVRCVADGGLGFCCNGSCVTESGDDDAQNCGRCGLICQSGRSCMNGACGVEGTAPSCSGSQVFAPPYCYATACALGQQGSMCAVVMADGRADTGICCGTNCTVIREDALNCNGCGLSCPAGAACLNGACTQPPQCSTASEGNPCLLKAGPSSGSGSSPIYPDGGIGMCCGGQCIDPALDDQNCSQCGVVCPLTSHCSRIADGLDLCVAQEALATCALGCDAGQSCTDGWCFFDSCADQMDGTICGSDGDGISQKCCGGVCADLGTSSQDCGQCGLSCPSGGSCVTAGCADDCAAPQAAACPTGTACTPGTGCLQLICGPSSNGDACAFGGMAGTCCNQLCVNLQANPDNCGLCGQACDGICNLGICQGLLPSTCLQTCGPQALCVDGACVGSICSGSGSGYCLARDGQPGNCCGDGACADLLNDVANCGACGLACLDGGACAAGVCTGTSCGAFNAGKYCGDDLNHQCCGPSCVDVTSDANNCGQCGTPCDSGVCVNGSCG